MAKDTEKLIRQLSLISYLMAERRPVTAMEIRRDVEGYSGMNEDAFARRFYADRSELESLSINLTVERPMDGAAEQENYSLRSENFHLRPIEFTDQELAALQTALHLLGGEFAYAEPLRLALQQITWGRPSPLRSPEQRSVALSITASAGGHELSQRLAKIETAIFRSKTVGFDYYTMERDEVGARRVDPYHLLFRGGEFYLLGYAHEREAIRIFKLSRIRGKVSYATKSEHDFKRPGGFDPRPYADRAEWQLGEQVGVAQIAIRKGVAWQIERHFGRYGEVRRDGGDGEVVFQTPYAAPRMIVSWVLGLGEQARLVGPAELVDEFSRRLALVVERHTGAPSAAVAGRGRGGAVVAGRVAQARGGRPASRAARGDSPKGGGDSPRGRGAGSRGGHGGSSRGAGSEEGHTDAVIRPERFARLVTLASILIAAGREGRRLSMEGVCEQMALSEQELRDDIAVLNVVNFGGGSYVLYAEIDEDTGEIEVDPEPYSDNFDRPARLLPVEAKALVAAIDLIGEHIPEGSLASARAKIVEALGSDPLEQGLHVASSGADDSEVVPAISRAITGTRVIELEYYKQDEGELSIRRAEPYALVNGREGWYVACFDLDREAMRHFRLDRIKSVAETGQSFKPRQEVDPAAEVDGWMRTGEVPASSTARVWISPERARWARETRRVVEELDDGGVVVELSFAGVEWLVREILKEAGDAVVLEPESAREAVLAAARRLRERAGLAVGEPSVDRQVALDR